MIESFGRFGGGFMPGSILSPPISRCRTKSTAPSTRRSWRPAAGRRPDGRPSTSTAAPVAVANAHLCAAKGSRNAAASLSGVSSSSLSR